MADTAASPPRESGRGFGFKTRHDGRVGVRVRGDRRGVVVLAVVAGGRTREDGRARGGDGGGGGASLPAAFSAAFSASVPVLVRLLDERLHSFSRDELAVDERGDGVAPAVRSVE